MSAKLDEILARLARLERALGPPPPEKPGLTVPEAARTLGLSNYTVRLACNTGRVKATKADNGRDWLIPPDEVERVRRDGLPPDRNRKH